jgi:type IV secretion system protein VirB10
MTDPTSHAPQPDDIRPKVAMPANNRGLWAFAVVLAMAGGLLFYALEMRRERITQPAVTAAPADTTATITAPPQLTLPPDWQRAPSEQGRAQYAPNEIQNAARLPGPGQMVQLPTKSRQIVPVVLAPANPAPPGTAIAWQGTTPPAPPAPPSFERPASPEAPKIDHGGNEHDDGKQRVEATRFANPATTVPKGTVIQAVLETALDSTRAGFARAIVSRDVYSFDGSRVLIQRGSRIIGEYKSDVALGQRRVLIQWQRLTRPDGVIIEMDSPSADPLGRAGVTGSVDNHFFQRFAGAILQSALAIGSALATQHIANNAVYIGLPGLTQGLMITPDKIAPTVKVKQGSSVSVFVARDLDFNSVQ